MEPQFSYLHPVTLVGAAPLAANLLRFALNFAPKAIAADGGVNHLRALGVDPLAVIGDMDSVALEHQQLWERNLFFPIAEQDSTDFEKSLARLAAPMIFGVGFLGGRFDHALAAQTVLVRYPHRKCILLGSEDIVFLAPPRLSLDLPLETRLSLFPMAPVKILSEGLYWPTRGLTFQPDGQVGTSNKVNGPLRLQPEKAKMLVILPRLHLAQVAAALDAAPSWPALGT